MYTLINKIEILDNIMSHTEVAQTNDEVLIEEININYDATLGDWIETNIVGLEENTTLLSDFFDATPVVYVATTIINYERSDLPLVTNIGEL